MAERTTNDTPVIDELDDGQRNFILQKLGDDRFVRTGKQIIEACELQISIDSWRQNLAELCTEMWKLASARAGRIKACFVVPRAGRVHVLFVPLTGQFDFELADELAKLNIRLRRQRMMYGLIEASQVPESELGQFLEPAGLDLKVYG